MTKITNITINSTNRQDDQLVASVRVTLEETQDFIDLVIFLPQDPKKTIGERDEQILERVRVLLSSVE